MHAFITTRLDYCNTLFSGLPAHSIFHLQYIQISAARLLTSTKKSAHITPILFNLHWLPVSIRVQYKILLLTFKALKGLAPSYLSDLLSYIPSRSLLSSSSEIPCVPIFNGQQILFCHGTQTLEFASPGTQNSHLSQ